ncbi:SITS-binding protein-like [Eudromia elegans]
MAASPWERPSGERREPWRGALACLAVAAFFALTIGVVAWQAAEAPRRAWLGAGAGLPLPPDRCRPEGRPVFCGAWHEAAELRVALEEAPDGDADATECYGLAWSPLQPGALLKDCFSMANVSWFGGGGVRAPRWPLNSVDAEAQPFVISDFSRNPGGYGPVLDGYFLGSTGVTVTVAPDVPLLLSVESGRRFCLEAPPGAGADADAGPALSYRLCSSPDAVAAQRHAAARLAPAPRRPPDAALLWSPMWRYAGPEGSASKIQRGLRALSRRLQRHGLAEGLVVLGERCAAALAEAAPEGGAHAREPPVPLLPPPLRLAVTLSPYASVASPLFLRSLRDGTDGFWLGLRPRHGPSVPLLSRWKGQLAARLDATSEAASRWLAARAALLRRALGAQHVLLEGAEGNAYVEQGVRAPAALRGDAYAAALAALAATLGNGTVVTAGARSSHLPLFVRMSPLRADWSHGGLKGLIPAALHFSLLGYSFLVPDAVGGSLPAERPPEQELYVRWLQIVTFLPVMAFGTPPWACCDAWVLNLTRECVRRHRDFVAPLIVKYTQEWAAWGHPVFRPVWWLSPADPAAFAVDDEFLIGDEVLVAPVTEKGQAQRDVYLPGPGCRWTDARTGRVFDGGAVLRNYSAGLAEVPVFVRAP